MATSARSILVMLAFVLIWPHAAPAGMPSVSLADVPPAFHSMTQRELTDLARQRLEVISFFLLGLLACAGVIRWLWNGLRKDFPILPRLSYPRALGMIVLWGLLFLLVLTMISGARELMTPGAWQKNGLTYRLVPLSPPPIEAEITARVEGLRRLWERLMTSAKRHNGNFPTTGQVVDISDRYWRIPSPSGGRYLYVGGRMPVTDGERLEWPLILAYEPESVGTDRLVLMTDGTIQWMPESEIKRELSSKEP